MNKSKRLYSTPFYFQTNVGICLKKPWGWGLVLIAQQWNKDKLNQHSIPFKKKVNRLVISNKKTIR
jgi:hypothetical protein